MDSRTSTRSSRRTEVVAEPEQISKLSCITVPRGVGFFAFLSFVLAVVIIIFGTFDIIHVSETDIHVVLRLDPVILKDKNPDYDGMKNYITIWFAASVAGIITGCIQSLTSVWFLVNAFQQQELEREAKFWLMSQLLVSFMLLTILGGIYIAGFRPDYMIMSFGADFILVNICILGSMPIIRKEGKQPKLGDIHLLGGTGTSAFTALLML